MMSEMYLHAGIRQMLHQMKYDIDCEVNEIAAQDGDIDSYGGFADVCNDEIYYGLSVCNEAIVYLVASAIYQLKCKMRDERPGHTSETGRRRERIKPDKQEPADKPDKADNADSPKMAR